MQPFGLGAETWDRNHFVSIDIRTTYKRAAVADIRAHLIKMKDEVLRIVEANVLDVDSDFHLMIPIRVRDRSDKSMGLGRYIIDISMRDWS